MVSCVRLPVAQSVFCAVLIYKMNKSHVIFVDRFKWDGDSTFANNATVDLSHG